MNWFNACKFASLTAGRPETVNESQAKRPFPTARLGPVFLTTAPPCSARPFSTRRRLLGSWTLVAWIALPSAVPVLLAAQPPRGGAGEAPASAREATSETTAASDALVGTESAVDGNPQRISDWALAGITWSDAHLVRRLAKHATRQATDGGDADRVRGLRGLQQDCDEMIDLLGRFGWRRLESRAAASTAKAEANAKADVTARAEANTDAEVAARARAKTPSEAKSLDLAARVETETPAGANDPGVDDEAIPGPIDFDLTRYRVDDYIDEREAEARNRADAIEDGIEGALAAGIDNISGNYGVGAASGRLSQRELSTRSNTLPYSKDSIYDSDDFDPDVDYDVNNPLNEPIPSDSNPLIHQDPAADSEESRNGENRGEIDQIEEPSVEFAERAKSDGIDVENEDDFVAALADNDSDFAGKASQPAERAAADSPADLRRFTKQSARFGQDAAWVQFHFDVNDQIWQTLPDDASPEQVRRMLDAAIVRLQSRARVARHLVETDDLEIAFEIIGKP